MFGISNMFKDSAETNKKDLAEAKKAKEDAKVALAVKQVETDMAQKAANEAGEKAGKVITKAKEAAAKKVKAKYEEKEKELQKSYNNDVQKIEAEATADMAEKQAAKDALKVDIHKDVAKVAAASVEASNKAKSAYLAEINTANGDKAKITAARAEYKKSLKKAAASASIEIPDDATVAEIQEKIDENKKQRDETLKEAEEAAAEIDADIAEIESDAEKKINDRTNELDKETDDLNADKQEEIDDMADDDPDVKAAKEEKDKADEALEDAQENQKDAETALSEAAAEQDKKEEDLIETGTTITEDEETNITTAKNEITGEEQSFASKEEAEAWAAQQNFQNKQAASDSSDAANAICDALKAAEAGTALPSQNDFLAKSAGTVPITTPCDKDAIEDALKDLSKTKEGRDALGELMEMVDDIELMLDMEEDEEIMDEDDQDPDLIDIVLDDDSEPVRGSIGSSTSDYTANATEENINPNKTAYGDRAVILGASKFICENLQPVFKHSYIGNFKDDLLKQLDWHIKGIDRPKHEVETVKQVRGNVERHYPVKYSHSTLTINFWDDVYRLTVTVLNAYLRKQVWQQHSKATPGKLILKDGAMQEKIDIYDFTNDPNSNIMKYTFYNILLTSYDFDATSDEEDEGFNVTVQFEFEYYELNPATLSEIDRLEELRNTNPACTGNFDKIPESVMQYTTKFGDNPIISNTGDPGEKMVDNIINTALKDSPADSVAATAAADAAVALGNNPQEEALNTLVGVTTDDTTSSSPASMSQSPLSTNTSSGGSAGVSGGMGAASSVKNAIMKAQKTITQVKRTVKQSKPLSYADMTNMEKTKRLDTIDTLAKNLKAGNEKLEDLKDEPPTDGVPSTETSEYSDLSSKVKATSDKLDTKLVGTGIKKSGDISAQVKAAKKSLSLL